MKIIQPRKVNRAKADGAANDDTAVDRPTLYALITNVIRAAVNSGLIEPGVVMLEGPVAALLHCTRTPVRQALQTLEAEGVVSRFEGRGYLAGSSGTEPQRVTLTAAMLGIIAEAEPVRKPLGWEAIYHEVERDVVHLSLFGRYRINELELARHFNVGRMVAHDVLLRLENLGLLEKDERQRWTVTPLDSARISHLFELRLLLEPVALRGAMSGVTVAEIKAMMLDLKTAMSTYPKVSPASLDKLEHDLHIGILSHCPNKDLLQTLQRTRCILTLSKHVLGASAPMPRRDPFMSEHLAVLKAIAAGDSDQAVAMLRQHLERSCAKVMRRAELVRRNYAMPSLAYIG